MASWSKPIKMGTILNTVWHLESGMKPRLSNSQETDHEFSG